MYILVVFCIPNTRGCFIYAILVDINLNIQDCWLCVYPILDVCLIYTSHIRGYLCTQYL
jgi:hypothetical protein